MRVKTGLGIVLVLLMGAGLSAALANSHKMKSDKELIRSAMSAAPASIGKDATVMAPDEQGKLRTVRKGTNEWICLPSNPGTPGKDPMCLDPNGFEWLMAYMGHKPPPDKVGFGYMLKGGWDASNTDPYAAPPEKKADWIVTPPHIMIFGPPVAGVKGYVGGAKPDTKLPYVMWAGTPYEHLMIPVK